MSRVSHDCPACTEHEREKLEWGSGPWQNEPNRVEWQHLGVTCIAHRGFGGSWCGYASVLPNHPFHGKGYSEIYDKISVHGGLTYSSACQGHICHTPAEEQPDNLWWFGFDCDHAGDLMPALRSRLVKLGQDFNSPLFHEDHYWTLEEVQEETNYLAEQLLACSFQRE